MLDLSKSTAAVVSRKYLLLLEGVVILEPAIEAAMARRSSRLA